MKTVGDLSRSNGFVFFPATRAALYAALGFCFAAYPGFIQAAKPEVSGLFPAGGPMGQTVEVEVAGKLGSAPVQVWSDREDVTAEVAKDGKKLQVTIGANAVPGVCWLRVWNAEGASSLRPFVVGRLPEVMETEPNETLTAAQTVEAAGCVVNGKLHKSGELDTFKVPLKKGQTLVADVLANRVLKSPMDAVLQIASAEGFLLAQADDSPRLDPRLAFTAPEAGDYFVRIFAFPETPNSSIRYAGGNDYLYRLTLTTGPYLHHTLPLAVQAGQPASLKLIGWNLPAEEQTLNVGKSEPFLPTLKIPAVVPLEMATVDHANLVEADAKGHSQPLAPPFSLTGHIGKADEIDRFQIAAKKDETLIVKVESAALGFPLDPVLEIRDAQGKSLQVTDDKSRNAADAETTWKVPADGTYEIHVTDRYQHGGWDYAYLLTVEQPRPEFQLSLAADAFTLAKDKPLEIPVTVARTNGFAEKIEIHVSGLPEGITAEPVISEPKGESAKTVKLKITAKGDMPFHGPVWIAGKAGEVEKTAATPASGASHKARHAWITYQPKK